MFWPIAGDLDLAAISAENDSSSARDVAGGFTIQVGDVRSLLVISASNAAKSCRGGLGDDCSILS